MLVYSICGGIFDLEGQEKILLKITEEMGKDTFWDDQAAAQKAIAESNEIKSWIEPYKTLKGRLDDVASLLPEAESSHDSAFLEELTSELQSIEKGVEELELRKMLSGEHDKDGCFLSVNAGAGGTEACDWAQMLLRMYERWASRRGWKTEVVDYVDGDVAGARSATLRIIGPFAYGYAKAEKGVHRLVRISPFDSNAKRHTSFAAVDVTPEISDDVAVEIKPEDVRVDTFRASGAGGQHVNKTDSAVRMTHMPTNTVVSCQSQRSQTQNREACMKMLRSKLYEIELEKRQKKIDAMAGEKKKIEWGSQIRSYVFQPYTLVNDHRTEVKIGNVGAVMDGEIDEFITAYLKEFSGQ